MLLVSWLLLLVVAPQRAWGVRIQWENITAPNNPSDFTGHGSVSYDYRIGTFEVTNFEYTEFLNATAASDPNQLYNPSMGSSSYGGIVRVGDENNYSYLTRLRMADLPVNYVSYFDALRFVNWLENGQPIGAQSPGTTEDGAYSLLLSSSSPARHEGAQHFLPNEEEWYKAAYYDPGLDDPDLATYHIYPTGFNAHPTCGDPSSQANAANCRFSVKFPTAVGAYAGAASPFGTFDQGGNLAEWTETPADSSQIVRGGSWLSPSGRFDLASIVRGPGQNPYVGNASVGFRIGSAIPEPGTGLLVGLGSVGFALLRRRQS